MEIAETGSRYTTSEVSESEELLTVSIRYKEPDADTSEKAANNTLGNTWIA